MVLVIDPQIAGIAGDMLLCSLVDMGANVEKIKKCASMGAQITGTSIRKLEFSKVQKCGISATKHILETDKQHNLHTGKNVAVLHLRARNQIFQMLRANLQMKVCGH